jgi:DNA-binding MarR family transcriptional regulator
LDSRKVIYHLNPEYKVKVAFKTDGITKIVKYYRKCEMKVLGILKENKLTEFKEICEDFHGSKTNATKIIKRLPRNILLDTKITFS